MHYLSAVISGGLLWVWLVIQPWCLWPGVPSDAGHQLTLTLCAAGMGLAGCAADQPRALRLPSAWLLAAGALLLVMLIQRVGTIASGDYFGAFLETAALADGALVLLACSWGLWALIQLPIGWLRAIRWAGLVMLLANIVLVICQRHVWPTEGLPKPIAGLLGLDRFLGAYAVAWLPILSIWRWWLAGVPLALLVLTGKASSWIGVAAVVAYRWPLRAWWSVPCAIGMVVGCADWPVLMGEWPTHLSITLQRWQTWRPLLSATLDHPWIGWGFSPLTMSIVRSAHAARLPEAHSDWLSLVLHAGWPVVALIACAWAWIVWPRSAHRRVAALQASMFALGVMALGHSLMSHARIAGLMVVLLAWWWKERHEVSA